jgi:predicted metal-dependent phosphoesterase TrpH
MHTADVEYCVSLIAKLWPRYIDEVNETQAERLNAHLSRMQINREQAKAIIDGAYTEKPYGAVPLEVIFKNTQRAHQDARIRGEATDEGEAETHEQFLRRVLGQSFRLYGFAAVARTQQHIDWCRRARALGLDLAEIAATALDDPERPYEHCREKIAEYGAKYRKYLAGAEQRWAEAKEANRLSKSQITRGFGIIEGGQA